MNIEDWLGLTGCMILAIITVKTIFFTPDAPEPEVTYKLVVECPDDNTGH